MSAHETESGLLVAFFLPVYSVVNDKEPDALILPGTGAPVVFREAHRFPDSTEMRDLGRDLDLAWQRYNRARPEPLTGFFGWLNITMGAVYDPDSTDAINRVFSQETERSKTDNDPYNVLSVLVSLGAMKHVISRRFG